MTQVAIEAHEISYAVDGKHILRALSFRGHRGGLTGLLGPNGAGKSTLLRILAGLNRPTTGTISLQGKPIHHIDVRDVARQIAYVPQDAQVAFGFNAREIVLMGRHPHIGRFSLERTVDYKVVADAMDRVGVSDFAERSIVTLSGGERQKVFIAKALAQQPQVLLLDEPVSALDIRHQLHILSLVRDLTRTGICAIAVLHDLNLAARFCDHIYMMADGEVVTNGTPGDVYTADTIARCYGVHAVVRHDDIVDSPAVTAVGANDVEAPVQMQRKMRT